MQSRSKDHLIYKNYNDYLVRESVHTIYFNTHLRSVNKNAAWPRFHDDPS